MKYFGICALAAFASGRLAQGATLYSSTPVLLNHSDPTNFFFDFEASVPLSEDVDVVGIHDDFYGVPWEAFMTAALTDTSPTLADLPLSWAIRLNHTMEAVIAWDKPVYLALEMLSGTLRTCPAQNASDGPGYTPSVTGFAGCSQCYDFNPDTNPQAAVLLKAYALYAAFYVDALLKVAPKGLVAVNYAAEINLGARLCDPDWFTHVTDFGNSVYTVLKTMLAQQGQNNVLVFPSLQLEVIAGMQSGPDQPCMGMSGGDAPTPEVLQCVQDGVALVAPILKDAFAVSTYPTNLKAGFPAQKPGWRPWYIPTILSALSPKDRASFAIAETGYDVVDIVINLGNGTVGASQGIADPPVVCGTILNATEDDANAWMTYLVQQAQAGDWPIVVWWSDIDLLWPSSMSSCPCTVPPAYSFSCTFITAYREIMVAQGLPPYGGEIDAKAFGSMGLRGLDGSKKQMWYTMQQARAAAQRDREARAAAITGS